MREMWERRFAVRSVVALSPEQLAGATIQALSLRDRFEREALNEWEKKHKPAEQATNDSSTDESKKQAEIASLIRQRVDGVVNTYVSVFAAPAGAPQDVFAATADQALFLSNDGRIQNWLSPASGTLLKRLQEIETPQALANELYLSVLSRPATESEVQELKDYLANRDKDRDKALREVTWALLSSLEFRFNH